MASEQQSQGTTWHVAARGGIKLVQVSLSCESPSLPLRTTNPILWKIFHKHPPRQTPVAYAPPSSGKAPSKPEASQPTRVPCFLCLCYRVSEGQENKVGLRRLHVRLFQRASIDIEFGSTISPKPNNEYTRHNNRWGRGFVIFQGASSSWGEENAVDTQKM